MSDDDITPTLFPQAQVERRTNVKCFNCDIELCKELDTYYGTDRMGKFYCSKCRIKMDIK